MTSLPDIPREAWPAHPRFPDQALLLQSHDAFRRRCELFIETVEHLLGEQPARRRRWLARQTGEFDWWLTGMHGHERYEESKLYPYLGRRYGVSFDALERDHRLLRDHQDAVRDAFGRATVRPAQDRPIALVVAALRRFRDELFVHLRAEEDLVVPLLLALPPEEFQSYVTGSARQLLGSS